MKLLMTDARGVEYTFDGRWSAALDDPHTRATLNGLEQLDLLGRKAFPRITNWSEDLPPYRQLEDNLRVAQHMGLTLVFKSSLEPTGDEMY